MLSLRCEGPAFLLTYTIHGARTLEAKPSSVQHKTTPTYLTLNTNGTEGTQPCHASPTPSWGFAAFGQLPHC